MYIYILNLFSINVLTLASNGILRWSYIVRYVTDRPGCEGQMCGTDSQAPSRVHNPNATLPPRSCLSLFYLLFIQIIRS